MKNLKSISSMFFILSLMLNSCKKMEVAPEKKQGAENTPTTSVSRKPVKILMTGNGEVWITKEFKYDSNGRLINFVQVASGLRDSAVMFRDSIQYFRTMVSAAGVSTLFLNTDRTFKELKSDNSMKHVFQNRGTHFEEIIIQKPGSADQKLATFEYFGDNVNKIIYHNSSRQTIYNLSYYDHLPFQKGINVIPSLGDFLLMQYGIAEMENFSSTTLYNKLLKEVTVLYPSGDTFTTHFDYVMDEHNRVARYNTTEINVRGGITTSRSFLFIIEY